MIDVESAHPQIPTTFNCDTGSAVPLANEITIAGGTGMATSGSGNTVTIAGTAATTSASGIVELATGLETQTGTDTSRAVTADGLQDLMAESKFTGFTEWGGSGSYYTVSGTDFTVDRAGVGYIKGARIAWVGSQTVSSLSAGSTHLIYIDSSGTIGSTTTFSQANYEDYIPLFEVLVDSDTPANVLVVKENHPYSAPTDLSMYLHNTVGVVISDRNLGANIVAGAAADEIGISGTDYLEDHGLETTIADSAGASETWNFFYTNAGGKWVQLSSTATFPSQYNNAGTPTALGAGKYGIFVLYASKDDIESATPKYIAVMDDAQYNNATQANTAISNGNVAIATNELTNLELARLGYVIYDQSGADISSILIDKATIRGSTIITGAATAALVTTSTTNFNGWLSSANSNVQSALDTLDDVGLTVTPQHAILVAGASYAISAVGPLTDGQLLIGSTGNAPAASTLTAGAGISVSNASGSVTISATGSGMAFEVVTDATKAMAVSTAYGANRGGGVTFTLPSTAAAGSVIEIVGMAGLWALAQNAGQTVYIGDTNTTTGVGGSLTATNAGDCMTIRCIVANTDFRITSWCGNITIV